MGHHLVSILIVTGILYGSSDSLCSTDLQCPPEGSLGAHRHRRSESSDPNLNILNGLSFPLKDATHSLEAFMQGASEDSDVLAVAEEMEWDSIKQLAQRETRVEKWKADAYDKGKKALVKLLKVAKKLKETGVVVDKDQAAYKHQSAFQITSNISKDMTPAGLVIEAATAEFKDKAGISDKATTGLPIVGEIADCLTEQSAFLQAPFQTNIVCNASYPYRSIDGSCNNLAHKLQGAAFTKYRRSLFPDYANGISTPRKASNGNALPSARLVSTTINRLPNTESPDVSIFHMTYGQFLDHDFTSTPITKFPNVTALVPYVSLPISCCDPKFDAIGATFSNQLGCFPIEIPANDSFYACHSQKCMEFKRSAPASTCFLAPREQINELSAYIDGSMIYSVKPPTNPDPLRTRTDGLLKVQTGDLLPPATAPDNGCNTPDHIAIGQFCFMAGDGRVNEQTWLAFFHTVFAREHNRLAKFLKDSHPTYDDEKIYQETRRIVGAQLQHVTYNEYLPTLLPNALMVSKGLLSETGSTQTTHYDPNIDATIANSFGASVFRFGHSQVGDFHHRVNSYGTIDTLEFSSTFFNPFYLYLPESVGNLARGSLQARSRQVDAYFTQEVSGKLFRGNRSFGLDLVALNIQRGRDHGIPGYTKFLKYCGKTVNSFSDLTSVMNSSNADALQSVYSNVTDIDLFAGAMSEFPLTDGLLGLTFTCLLTDQFQRLKFGDRFWYEETNQAGSFTPDQMEELHSVSLAKIMCNNIPELKAIQRYPFLNPGPDNPMMSCDCPDFPDFSLEPWN